MKREEVFKIIDAERKHQLKFEGTDGSHIVSSLNMGGILTAIEHNLTKARAEWYEEKSPYHKTSDLLRKIAALCVKAGEDYGMTEREIDIINEFGNVFSYNNDQFRQTSYNVRKGDKIQWKRDGSKGCVNAKIIGFSIKKPDYVLIENWRKDWASPTESKSKVWIKKKNVLRVII